MKGLFRWAVFVDSMAFASESEAPISKLNAVLRRWT